MKRILMSGAAAVAITGLCAASPADAAQKPDTAGHHTYKVVKSADDGSVGTLRWAIAQADAGPGGDTILLSPAVGVIHLRSLLPAITKPVTIEAMRACLT